MFEAEWNALAWFSQDSGFAYPVIGVVVRVTWRAYWSSGSREEAITTCNNSKDIFGTEDQHVLPFKYDEKQKEKSGPS